MLNKKTVHLPPVSDMVEIIGGKYGGHVGVVERYTPKMVEVCLLPALAHAGASKTFNQVVMIRKNNIELRTAGDTKGGDGDAMNKKTVHLPPVSDMVEIIGGKYGGHVGVVERYTPKMVEVCLLPALAHAGAIKTFNQVVMIRKNNIGLRTAGDTKGGDARDGTARKVDIAALNIVLVEAGVPLLKRTLVLTKLTSMLS
jgi:transcription antitermination factor NusG